MKPPITNAVCRLRCAGHCGQCRADADWRRSVGTPEVCGDTRGPWTGGPGDLLAAAASALGIRPCGGCKGRIRFLNRAGTAVVKGVKKLLR